MRFAFHEGGRAMARLASILTVALFVAACGGGTATPTTGTTPASAAAGTPTSPTSQATPTTPAGTPAATATAAPTAGSDRPWMASGLSVDQRVSALLGQMTLDEKIGQMTQVENKNNGRMRDPAEVTQGFMGSVLSGGDGNPQGENTADNWYTMVNGYQQAALATRLGIPMLYGVDATHGDAHLTGTTIFPQNVGMGATHDPALVTQACQVTAKEMMATGVRWTFAPVVAVPQDIRWGRTYEGYGENTDLVTQLGDACVQGFQGPTFGPDSVATDPKHYLGDGGTAYGSSKDGGPTGPYLLDRGTDQMTDEQIRTLFLPPYVKTIKDGARIIMVTFSATQSGGQVTGDKHWLTDVLKTELGFTGFVVSDWQAIDRVNSDYTAAVKQSINAGIDMSMVPDDWQKFQSTLKGLVSSGEVPQARIDDAVSRILRVKFELGLFEQPMPPAGQSASVGSSANRAVAAKAVSESAVLLKTKAGVLPIASGASVLLAGKGADDIGIASGGWTISWQGVEGNFTTGTTLKAALTAKLGDGLNYAADGSFAAGTHAKVGVVVVAERPYSEGVGDTSTLALPAEDLAVVDKVRPMVDKLIVVVISGRPVMLDNFTAKADAIVAAWLPGTEGQGLADVLLGAQPFSGTTPYTWPKTPNDAPRTGKTACQGAVYPFGYGLKSDGSPIGPAACS